ncbi:MAG TPA: hypothetical protein VFT99_18295, partial [Roseiflexaceae bacterium]|nr:hypothetical protein [Roseiflexaceae bacterium]
MHARHRTIRRTHTMFAMLLALLCAGFAGGVIPVARAASGSVILEIRQAEAVNHNTDYEGILPWRWQQDMFPKLGVGDFVTPPVLSQGPEIEQRDWAVWDPAFSNTHTWADVADLNGGDVRGVVQLFDNDDALGTDHLDINPANSNYDLQLRFNPCSLRFSRDDDPLHREFTGFTWIDRGFEGDPARVQVRMRTADGRSFLPNNVAIAEASPVQTVFNPMAIIDGKATAFMVELTSSHPGSVNATVTVTLFDGFTTATDTKPVVIPPEGLRAFFFDGSGTAAPSIPHKQPNMPRLNYTVNVDVPADSNTPNPSGPFPNCVASADNTLSSSTPIVITDSPGVVYLPWDWRAI